MTDTIRTWTRRELEETAAAEPEFHYMVDVRVFVRLLLLMIDWHAAQTGERVEILSAYGDPSHAELRFFQRD